MARNTNGNQFKYLVVNTEKELARKLEIHELKKNKDGSPSENDKKNRPSLSKIFDEAPDPSKQGISLIKSYLASDDLSLIANILDIGYGQSIMWDERCVLDTSIANKLANYSLARLKLAESCIRINRNNEYVIEYFHNHIEASEKASISFILGGVFSYLAAVNWVNSFDDNLKSFLHTSVYSISSLNLKKKTKKSPDYLVETEKGKWHIFESKGGHYTDRWNRIEEGLQQLDSITQVSWVDGVKNEPPESQVCTFSSIDAGQPIQILVVDPQGNEKEEIILNRAICFLVKKIIALDQYNCFIKKNKTFEIEGMTDWTFISATHFENIEIGIPSHYLSYQDEIRIKLGAYLMFRKHLMSIIDNPKILPYFFHATIQRMGSLSRKAAKLVIDFLNNKSAPHPHKDALLNFSDYLQLDKLVEILELHDDLLHKKISDRLRHHLTSNGTLICHTPSKLNLDPWSDNESKIKKKPKPRY